MARFSVSSEPAISDLQQRILGLPPKFQAKGLRLGATAAVKPMVTRLRGDVPVQAGGGALKRGVGFRTLTIKRRGQEGFTKRDFAMEAGVIKAVSDPLYKRSPGKVISQEFKARFLEGGVKPHSTRRGARLAADFKQDGKLHPGISPNPFFARAYAAESPYFEERFTAEIDKFLAEI